MDLDFYCDYHLGAPNELKGAPNLPKTFNKNVYFIGDIFDLANCSKKDVISLNSKLKLMKKIHRWNWIDGNHERQKNEDTLIYITRYIGAMHGDEISWGKERSIKYRSKDHGASFIKRGIWVNALEIAELGLERDLSKEDLQRADDILQANNSSIRIVIVGHMHVHEIKYFITPQKRMVVVLPRGKTTLNTDKLEAEYVRRTV